MKGHKSVLPASELISLYTTKKTAVAELSKKYGISIQAIYCRLRKLGIKVRSNSEAHKGLQIGEKNSFWKGGRRRASNGYILIRHEGRDVYEHRLVAEKTLGRMLLRGEIVHHKNHDITDNRAENLEVISSHGEHMKRHLSSERAREIGRRHR